MTTLIEISSVLAKTFIHSRNKKYAAKIIVREISSLLYSNTKQSIDYTIKIAIVQVMHELINGERPFELPGKETISVTKKDFSRFSRLEGYIRQEIWEKHQLQENELRVNLNRSNVSVKTFTLNFSTIHK